GQTIRSAAWPLTTTITPTQAGYTTAKPLPHNFKKAAHSTKKQDTRVVVPVAGYETETTLLDRKNPDVARNSPQVESHPPPPKKNKAAFPLVASIRTRNKHTIDTPWTD
ncbi:unnamed protein product, partial [Ectocarpus sp. 4 AP-2014]